MPHRDDKIVKEVRWQLGKNTWLIPIRQSMKMTGFFVRVGAPLFLYIEEETIEAIEKKLESKSIPKTERKNRNPLYWKKRSGLTKINVSAISSPK